jgi:hypothetical protein
LEEVMEIEKKEAAHAPETDKGTHTSKLDSPDFPRPVRVSRVQTGVRAGISKIFNILHGP